LAEEAQVLLWQGGRCLLGHGVADGLVEGEAGVVDQAVEIVVGNGAAHGVFTLSREVRNKEPSSSKMAPRNSFCWLICTSQRSSRRIGRMSPGRRARTCDSGICRLATTQSRRTGN